MGDSLGRRKQLIVPCSIDIRRQRIAILMSSWSSLLDSLVTSAWIVGDHIRATVSCHQIPNAGGAIRQGGGVSRLWYRSGLHSRPLSIDKGSHYLTEVYRWCRPKRSKKYHQAPKDLKGTKYRNGDETPFCL